MLTRDDLTVEDCLEVFEAVRPLKLGHVGFKDLGVDFATLRELNRRIKESGAVSYMELISLSPEECAASAGLAAEIGVDRLLGGAGIEAILEALKGSRVGYYPFVGLPEGHPTRLRGGAEAVARHCREALAEGCPGVDLLAYRAVEAAPLDLVRAARAALGANGRLIVAGSVNSPATVREIAAAGADAFTVGSAVFDGSFSPRAGGLAARLNDVLAATGSVPRRPGEA